MSDQDPQSQAQKAPGGGKTLQIALLVSLAVNMFLLGAGAVTLVRSFGHHEERQQHFFFAGRAREFPPPSLILRVLPDDERARLDKIVGPKRQAMREAIIVAKRQRAAAFQAFGAQSYSATDMDARLKAMRAADVTAVNAVHDVLAELIDGLTPDDRAAIMEEIRAHGMGSGRPGGGLMGDGTPPTGPPQAPPLGPGGPPPPDGP